MAARAFDLVLYGATGFTGRLAAAYLAAHAPAGLRWAIAGRDPARLEQVQRKTGAPAIEVADSSRPETLSKLAARARVLASTAGPFARYGMPVVEACLAAGTHYADITGEIAWVRQIIDRFHARAAAAGTRIVSFCGFDSVPSDLGTQLVAEVIRERWGQPTRRVSASFRVRGGGLNGGTLASALDAVESPAASDASDPLYLNPPEQRSEELRRRNRDFRGVRHDPDRNVWLAPFVMAEVNTRVVRRSQALLAQAGEGYGPDFTYEEALEVPGRLAALATAFGSVAGDALIRLRPFRALLRRVGPKPGEGPSEEAMARGSFRACFLGEAADGRKVLATVAAQGDAGNKVTVTCLCESALALSLQLPDLPGGPGYGGVLTPATALGAVLRKRLIAAGFRFDVASAAGA